MVARVLLDQNGLKVSASGYDVTTASGDQLLIDTNRGRYLGVYKTGFLLLSDFTLIGAPTISTYTVGETYQKTVTYGKTFASPPVVMACYQSPQSSTAGTDYFYNDNVITITTTTGSYGYGGITLAVMRSFTDRLVCEVYRSKFGGADYISGPAYIGYLVGQY